VIFLHTEDFTGLGLLDREVIMAGYMIYLVIAIFLLAWIITLILWIWGR